MNEMNCRRLLLAYHPAFLEHDAGPGHPEFPERVEAIMGALEAVPWSDRIVRIEAREATQAEVSLVHNPKYVEAMRRLCDAGGEFLPRMEAAVGEASYPAALRAVGAGLALADAMMTDPAAPRIGFAPTRPPGHHAVYERPQGFCIFNNVSILARYLQTRFGLRKVAIVDFDVHHGNGTEEAFWRDPGVLYISLHRDNSYPYNKGRLADSGGGEGAGYTLNIPLPKGSDDNSYARAFDRYVIPKIEEFKSEFLLASAGFDAHVRDPLGMMGLTDEGYRSIGEKLKAIADCFCAGRVISLLEGGYDLQGLAGGVVAYLEGMLEDGQVNN